MELLRILHDPVRRKAIFSDISKTPPLTHELWQELLLYLGRANFIIVTRGGSRPLSTSSAPRAAPAPDPRAIPIKQGDIFRPVVKKPSSFGLSSLDGPVRTAVPSEPVLRINHKAQEVEIKAVGQAKQIQGEVTKRIEANPTGHQVLGEAEGWLDAIYGWMGIEWARRNVERALPDQGVIRLLIEGTCSRI